jgi:hypothetical protein
VDVQVDVDISFNMDGGPAEAARIRGYMDEHGPLRPLTLVVKQFLAQRRLNEVYTGGLGSYAIMLMVLSFLQLHPRGEATGADCNLGVLLIEFFELYGLHFNYERVGLSVRGGGSYFEKVGVTACGHMFDVLCSRPHFPPLILSLVIFFPLSCPPAVHLVIPLLLWLSLLRGAAYHYSRPQTYLSFSRRHHNANHNVPLSSRWCHPMV